MNRYKLLAAAAFALLLAAGCSSYNSSYNPYSTYNISGTVDSVDLNSQSIYLTNTSGYTNSLLPEGGSNNVRIFYNNRTTVYWQGRSYRPQDLEPGDKVTVRLNQNGSQLIAQSMDVTFNSRQGMASSAPPYNSYNSIVHGTVRSVDRYGRTITIDPGTGGSWIMVNYGSNTPVYSNGRTFLPADLQIGDEIDVRGSDLGGGRFSAQDITVTSSISGMPATNAISTIRGTVRDLDSRSRTMTLDNSMWLSGPLTNPGSSLMVQWNPGAQVNFQGTLYPVTNLQPGDVIDVQLQDLGGGNFLARQISVYRDVNGR